MLIQFGKYELVEKIGVGGMASIFLARSAGAEGLEKTLVIKRILPEHASNERFIEMFIAEAKIAVHLNHPNIVQIYDFGKADGDFYLAMEYVEGFDLARILDACRRVGCLMPIGDALYIAIELAKGLNYAHRRKGEWGEALGIVHRDISPQNVLISADGTVKIVDFGIAKATSVTEDSPKVVKGKYGYMSPEQASARRVDQRSDLFSLGVVLFEMLCGRALFRQESREETLSLVKSAVVPDIASLNPEVPPKLEQVLYKALARDPSDRYQDARELQVDLTKMLYEREEIYDAVTLSQFLGKLDGELDRGGGEATAERTAMTSVMQRGSEVVAESTQVVEYTTSGELEEEGAPADAAGGLVVRERKECVIIAGEVIGLLELRGGREDPTGWMQVLQEYTRMVDSIAFKNEGLVHRVSEDGFVIVLGVPVSSENDAERACLVALDLQEAIAGMSFSLESPLQLAMGVVVGEVVVERGREFSGEFSWSFYDESQGLAEHLVRSAMARELLLGGQIWRRVRRGYECEAVDEVHFEGVGGDEQRLTAYRLVRRKTQAEQLKELRQSYHAFYGRDIELRTLRERYRATLLDGRASGVVVTGEQGIGKSTLVEEFLGGLASRDVRVVRGVVSPFKRDVPLGAMADFIGDLMRLGSVKDLRHLRETLRERVERLCVSEAPEDQTMMLHSLGSIFGITYPGGAFRQMAGEERRRRVFMSLARVLTSFASKKPIILAIEDAHHIDSVTLEFATEFLSDAPAVPAFFLATALSRGPHVAQPGWRGFMGARGLHEERLEELGDRDARALVRGLLQLHHISDEGLVDEILFRSGGNPLFIREVVEVLRDRGLLKSADERRQLREIGDEPRWLPASVEGLIGARIDRLGVGAKQVLQRVALLGASFTVEDAVRLAQPLEVSARETPAPVPDVSAELEALVGSGFLIRSGDSGVVEGGVRVAEDQRQYRFRNALTKEVASRGLLPEEARALHGRIAAGLLSIHRTRAEVAAIARHLDEAGEADRAAEFYAEAAMEALHDFGAAEALRLCAKVRERVAPGHPRYRDVLLTEEGALQALGEPTRRRAVLDLLESLVDGSEGRARVEVLRRKARYFYDASDFRAARRHVTLAREEAEKCGSQEGVAQSWELEALILVSEGRRGEALDLLERSIATYGGLLSDAPEEAGDSRQVLEGLANSYNLKGVVLRQSGKQEQALEAYEEALVYARQGDLRKQERYLLINTGLALVYLGHIGEALRRYEEALGRSERLGNRKDQATVLVNQGHALLLVGRVDRAIRKIRRGVYLARKTEHDATIADGQVSLGLCYLEQGSLKAAEGALMEGLRIADSIPNRYLSVHATLAMAEVRLAAGGPSDARIALLQAEDAVERAEEARMGWAVVEGKSKMARALRLLGRREEAVALSREALSTADEQGGDGLEVVLYHHSQILPDDEEHRGERAEAIEEARERVLMKRDKLVEPELRRDYLGRAVNKEILSVYGVMWEAGGDGRGG